VLYWCEARSASEGNIGNNFQREIFDQAEENMTEEEFQHKKMKRVGSVTDTERIKYNKK
jgi:hypothetical protein